MVQVVHVYLHNSVQWTLQAEIIHHQLTLIVHLVSLWLVQEPVH